MEKSLDLDDCNNVSVADCLLSISLVGSPDFIAVLVITSRIPSSRQR